MYAYFSIYEQCLKISETQVMQTLSTVPGTDLAGQPLANFVGGSGTYNRLD